MRKRALIIAGLLVCALVGPLASSARAGGSGDGWTDGTGVGATANSPTGPATVDVSTSGGSRGAPVCSYQALGPTESAMSNDMAAQGWGPPKGTGAGAWYRQICVDSTGNSTGIVVWVPQAAPVNPLALAQQALGYTPMPPPRLGMSPPPGRDQLVNLTTFLWLDQSQWHPVSASASAGGVTAATTATPERVVWDMAPGQSVNCDGPGMAYDPSKSDADQPDPCRFV